MAPTRKTPSRTLPRLDRFLTYRMHVINKVSDRDSAAAYAETVQLPIGEARCLAAIGSFAPLSVNDLARAANLNKGQASRCAQALTERGLVIKENSPEDGRGVMLRPTAAGEVVHLRIMELIDERNRQIFGCLDAEEIECLEAMLDKVIAHLHGADVAED